MKPTKQGKFLISLVFLELLARQSKVRSGVVKNALNYFSSGASSEVFCDNLLFKFLPVVFSDTLFFFFTHIFRLLTFQ